MTVTADEIGVQCARLFFSHGVCEVVPIREYQLATVCSAAATLATLALAAELERIRPYAQHKPECVMREWHNSNPDRPPCDCGFTALKKPL